MPLRADRVKQRRLLKGHTQQDLAGRLGVSQQQVGRWESGISDASADSVAQIARALECTADWLLGLTDQPQGHARQRELSLDEQRLIDLYRQGKLPEMISRLVNELAGAKPQESLVVDRPDQPDVSREDVPLDR